jgi:lysophospholipase L1-like esterase
VTAHSTLFGWLAPRARTPSTGAAPPPGFLDPIVEQYVANMRRLRDVARARGGGFLVVLQPELGRLARGPSPVGPAAPTDFDVGDRYWLHFPQLYAEFVTRAAARLAGHGIDVLDGATLVPDPAAYLDPVHLNVAGHDRLARQLAPHVDRVLAGP